MSDFTGREDSNRHRASTAGVSPIGDEVVLANTNPSWKNWNASLLAAMVAFAVGVTAAVMGESPVPEDITVIGYTIPIGEIPLSVDVPAIGDLPLIREFDPAQRLPFGASLPVEDIPMIGERIVSGGSLLLASAAVTVAAILIGYIYLLRKRQRYVVTDERVIKRTGLLQKSTSELRRDAISAIHTEASLIGRLAGRGTVIVEGRATDERLEFEGVNDYREFAAQIRRMLSEKPRT